MSAPEDWLVALINYVPEERAMVAAVDYRDEYQRWWKLEDAIELATDPADECVVRLARAAQFEITHEQARRSETLDRYWIQNTENEEE